MSLASQISSFATRVGTEFKTAYGRIGTLANLTTTAKGDLVSAINEVNARPTGAINDTTPSTSTTYSSSKTDSQIATASTADRLRSNHSGTQPASSISDFASAADARITAQKGQNSGLASLDSGGKVPAAQLPSYVDDVLEGTNLAAFPATGETGKMYVALDTNRTYRWSGSAYVEISPSPGSTDAVPEGSTNLYYTNGRAAAAAPVQSVAGQTGAVSLAKGDVGLGNVDNTSDANKPVSTAQATAIGLRLEKSQNLSDLANAATARTNLSVYSQTEIGNPETNFVTVFETALA